MKTPVDIVEGVVTDYDERSGVLTIKAQYPDWPTIVKRGYKKCIVQLVDSRPLSDKQRRACYALIREIADWSGDDTMSTKEIMKIEYRTQHLEDLNEQIFSLSNAPMSLVADFQRFLVRFIVSNNIPTRIALLDFVDDVGDYMYSCLINKKCAVCGRKADLHHIDRVGMGRDREEIIHEGMEAMPLCREHHNECHTIGQQTFLDKYHFDGGIEIDKTICRIYGLKGAQNGKRGQ